MTMMSNVMMIRYDNGDDDGGDDDDGDNDDDLVLNRRASQSRILQQGCAA